MGSRAERHQSINIYNTDYRVSYKYGIFSNFRDLLVTVNTFFYECCVLQLSTSHMSYLLIIGKKKRKHLCFTCYKTDWLAQNINIILWQHCNVCCQLHTIQYYFGAFMFGDCSKGFNDPLPQITQSQSNISDGTNAISYPRIYGLPNVSNGLFFAFNFIWIYSFNHNSHPSF